MTEQITKDIDGSKGRYVFHHPNGSVSELTFSIMSPQTVIADHTAVAPDYEGQGIGAQLVATLIADAKSNGFRIIPLCPYVNAQRRKHPEWAAYFNV